MPRKRTKGLPVCALLSRRSGPFALLGERDHVVVMMRNTLTGARLFTDNPHNTTYEPVFSERLDKP